MLVKKAGTILINSTTKEIALVYRDKHKDMSFPKGHLEKGETFEEAIDLDRKAFKVEGQLAEKKQTFISLPKVLILHFNLYNEQNPNRKQRLDFNFPEKLDLTKYVEGGDEIKYNLYASIMHNGFLNSGHYYIYLKPKLDGNYCLFNNENVSEQSNPSYFLNFANAKDTKEQKEYRDSSYPYIKTSY